MASASVPRSSPPVSLPADGHSRVQPATDYPELLDRVPAIIYVADPGASGRWHYASSQIQTILGFSPEEWCADPQRWARQLHPEDRERVIGSEPSLAGGEPESGASEYRLLHHDGHVVWIRDDAVLVRDRDGQPRWHGVLSDITARKQAEDELEQRARQQSAVARLGEHALEGATTTALMDEAVRQAREILGVDAAAVLELIVDEDHFVVRSAIGERDPNIQFGFAEERIATGAGSQAGYTIVSGEPVAVTDWDTEERFAQPPELRGMRSGLTVRIEGTLGPFGVLGVQSRQTRRFSAGDVDFLQSLANVLADAIERQATEDGIRHRALHDPLTGLPNRVLFHDRLEHALARSARHSSIAAVLFLDIDRFKLVNDSLGHHIGDELLAAATPRLKQAVRASDTVARFGGDEFGILLEDLTEEHDAIEMAERIAAVFTRPFVLAGNEHFVTTSIGIALARDGQRANEMIRDADAAMYRAKERGRARYEVFDEVMRGRAIARLRVENELRRALERDELVLEYQPVVSLAQKRIVSVEALLRWQHPERGTVSPNEFVPIAEEDGLIEPIGRWVLETACRDVAEWHRVRPDEAPIGISVNLSAVQLARRGLADVVETALRGGAVDPSFLSLEITESMMLQDAESLTEVLHELKATGVRLVLDDFGTGYSSLGYLTRMPLDALKVDRSFVDGLGVEPRATAITEAIIAMSRALSLEVVGEGVETPLQADELARLGCDLAQGFLFARPMPPTAITRMLEYGLALPA
jgi:diguanylate cyclase (GGDEF)-like protein/PAS domain S-box-containing protein